jgi:hypothetical protein
VDGFATRIRLGFGFAAGDVVVGFSPVSSRDLTEGTVDIGASGESGGLEG